MTKKVLMASIFLVYAFCLQAQTTDSLKEYYFPEIGWHILLPAKYKQTDAKAREENFQRGKEILLSGNGYDTATKIAHYQSLINIHPDQVNYMDALIKQYNDAKYDNWSKLNSEVHKMMAKAFTEKLPDAHLDTLTTWENIGGVRFTHFSMALQYLNNLITLKMEMFGALINGYDVGINFAYVDRPGAIGKELLEFFQKSEFLKAEDKVRYERYHQDTKIDVGN